MFPSIFHFQLSKFSLLWEIFFKICTFLGKNWQEFSFFKEILAKCALYLLRKKLHFWEQKVPKSAPLGLKFPPTHIFSHHPPLLVFGRILTYEHLTAEFSCHNWAETSSINHAALIFANKRVILSVQFLYNNFIIAWLLSCLDKRISFPTNCIFHWFSTSSSDSKQLFVITNFIFQV